MLTARTLNCNLHWQCLWIQIHYLCELRSILLRQLAGLQELVENRTIFTWDVSLLLDALEQNLETMLNKACITSIICVEDVELFITVLPRFLLSRGSLELAQDILPEFLVLFKNFTHNLFKYLFLLLVYRSFNSVYINFFHYVKQKINNFYFFVVKKNHSMYF